MPLPPGPAGLPFIGNLLDMPKSSEWEVYHKWSRELSKLFDPFRPSKMILIV
jgi:hypothetical protein